MITYQYKCKNCEHIFDKMQSIKDNPLKKCPKCKKHKLFRLIGSNIVILFEPTKIKTFGSQSEYNLKEVDKGNIVRKKKEKKKRPWWRTTDKIDYSILTNKEKYINEGKI